MNRLWEVEVSGTIPNPIAAVRFGWSVFLTLGTTHVIIWLL